MPDRIVSNTICFNTQKYLTTLNKIGVLLKDVLIDLSARNFVHTETTLHAHCVQFVEPWLKNNLLL